MRDLGLTQTLAPQVPDAMVPVLVAITFLGGPKVVAVAATLGSWIGLRQELIDRRTAIRFLTVVVLTLGVSLVLKNGLELPRPPVELHRVQTAGYGFPSGHATATAGIAFTAAALLEVGNRRVRYAFAIAAVGVIAATRILLGVHYLVDVLVGALVGLSVVMIGLTLSRRHLPGTVGLSAIVVGVGLLLRGL